MIWSALLLFLFSFPISAALGDAASLFEKYEKECIQKGWKKLSMKVGDLERNVLWKAPNEGWLRGAIVALHGGGGAYSNYCANLSIGQPMVEFGERALAEGYALFLPDSTSKLTKDDVGNFCGKRWDSLAHGANPNQDIEFLKTLMSATIPELRPPSAAREIYLTGISNGGFMTILAATQMPKLITAFAPVAAGDPFSTKLDCSEKGSSSMRSTPGIFLDRQSNKSIAEDGSCGPATLPDPALASGLRPPFMFFYHERDGGVDVSCKKKAIERLTRLGFPQTDSFIIKSKGWKSVFKHLWQEEYNAPLLAFLKKSETAGDFDLSLQHDGLTRTYRVHVPASRAAKGPYPLVIYVHGGWGNARSAYLDKMDQTSDKFGFILAAPEGTGQKSFGQVRGMWNGGTWETGSCCGEADDVGFISKMIDAMKERFEIDPKAVYATGISNGGLMTNRLGCELSTKIAAIATVAPAGLPSSCKPARPLAVLDLHGLQDECSPFNGGEPPNRFCRKVDYKRMPPAKLIERWRAIQDCSEEAETLSMGPRVTCAVYSKCRPGAVVEFCKVDGMGHAWPSGFESKKMFGMYPISHDISGDQIWEFFKKHPMK